MKRLILIPVTIVTAFLAFAFLQPSTAGGVLHAVAPTLLAALPATISQATGAGLNAPANNGGSGSSAQASGQGSDKSSRATGALSNPSDALVNPETKSTTSHAVSTAGQVNCGRFGGGFHGGKHLFVCPNPPFPPPANQ
jgi:hypothetical protein